MKHFPFSIFNCQFFLIIVVCTLCASADACVLDVKPDQGVQLTFVETTELRGAHEGLPSPAFGEAVATCLEHGLVTADRKEYYLVADNGLLDGLMMGEPAEIRVLADVYEFVDYYGVTLLMADVKELEILPRVEPLPAANRWIALYDLYGNSGIPDWMESVFTLGADTVMDGKTYQRLLNGKNYYGAIRYTEDMSKLYYRSHSGEYLLCDFSLNVGDSCALYLNDCPDIHQEQILQQYLGTFTPMWTVINKDWVDGRCRMIVSTTVTEHFEGVEGYTRTISAEMIEGVGSQNVVFLTYSALSEAGWAGGAPRFTVCALRDDESLYSYDLTLWGLVNDCPSWYMIDDQGYFPEGIEWKVLDQSGDIDISEARVQVLSVTGDTTIQDNTYHLIDGYPLRQEGKKVYLFDTYSSEDVLLYDFALAPGDSILYGESYVKVASVEQVILQDGRPARKINYIGRASDMEYVGSVSSGLLAPYEVFRMGCYSKQLLCCSVGGEPIYETSPGACTITALPEVEPTDSPVRKLLQDGRLVILSNGIRYNICGAKIQ